MTFNSNVRKTFSHRFTWADSRRERGRNSINVSGKGRQKKHLIPKKRMRLVELAREKPRFGYRTEVMRAYVLSTAWARSRLRGDSHLSPPSPFLGSYFASASLIARSCTAAILVFCFRRSLSACIPWILCATRGE